MKAKASFVEMKQKPKELEHSEHVEPKEPCPAETQGMYVVTRMSQCFVRIPNSSKTFFSF
jgi:hypothetical protein